MIPAGVKVAVNAASRTVNFEGPKGKLSMIHRPEVGVKVDGSKVEVTMDPAIVDVGGNKAFWGTTRALINNMVKGVSDGFTINLEINGVGYRAQADAKTLKLQLGFSHDVEVPIPAGIQIKAPKPTEIEITGADRQKVGQLAAEIRSLRPPEPYKGKGIKYVGEYIFRKEGKKK